MAGSAARNPLWREGHSRYAAASRPPGVPSPIRGRKPEHERDGRAAASRRGRRHARQDHGRRAGLWRHLVWRRRPATPGTWRKAPADRARDRARPPPPGSCAFAIGTETLGSIVYPSTRWRRDRPSPDLRARAADGAPCRSAGRSTRSGRCAARSPIRRWCSPPSTGPTTADPVQHRGSLRRRSHRLRSPASRWASIPTDFADPDAHDLDRAALETARGLGARLVPLTRPDLPYATR